MQLIVPLESSASLLFQSMATASYSQPRRAHSSFAIARSKPSYVPSAAMKPNGGNSASKPTISFCVSPPCASCASPVSSAVSFLLPQAARASTITAASAIAKNFFIVSSSCKFRRLAVRFSVVTR